MIIFFTVKLVTLHSFPLNFIETRLLMRKQRTRDAIRMWYAIITFSLAIYNSSYFFIWCMNEIQKWYKQHSVNRRTLTTIHSQERVSAAYISRSFNHNSDLSIRKKNFVACERANIMNIDHVESKISISSCCCGFLLLFSHVLFF